MTSAPHREDSHHRTFIESTGAAIASLSKPVLVTSALYLVPKIMKILTERPQQVRPGTSGKIDRLRIACADANVALENKLGEKNWAFINNAVVDNAWVSSLVFSILLKDNSNPLTPTTIAYLGMGGVAISTVSWVTRYALTRNVPSLAPWVAPRGSY